MRKRMKKDIGLIAYCGLYCGACSFKVTYEQKSREHIKALPSRYDEYKDQPFQSCPGCREDPEGADCEIRNCARQKSVDHCGVCHDFPCKIITDFCNDGVPHHAAVLENLQTLKDKGVDAWLKAQKVKWTCECGNALSWYLRECIKCSKEAQ